MNKWARQITALSLALSLSLGGALLASSSFAATKTYKVGDKFSQSGIAAGSKATVLQILSSDLNKDGKVDTFYLVGNQADKTSPFIDKLTYVVKDGKTGKFSGTVLKDEGKYDLVGYMPTVTIQDVTGDKQPDVLLSFPTGGSGGMMTHRLSTLKSGKWVELLGEKDLTGLTITGQYADDFKVKFHAKEIDADFTIDVSYEKDMLIEYKYYDKDGKYLGGIEPWAYGLNDLKVVDAYGMIMLEGSQRIVGTANADTIGEVKTMIHYENGKWVIKVAQQITTLKYNF